MTHTVRCPFPIIAKIGLMRNCTIALENFDLAKDVLSSCHERGTKKNSKSPWGIEP